jgi:hypothetical protein
MSRGSCAHASPQEPLIGAIPGRHGARLARLQADAGHDHLKRLGVALVPTSAPDHFTEDTPTAILVRQVLGAIAQFDKATLVATLKAARDRKRAHTGKCGDRRFAAALVLNFTEARVN